VYDRDQRTRDRALHTRRRLRIGVYNLEFHQRGGGEKRALVLAEHWATHHDVIILSDADLDRVGLERYFSVALGDVKELALSGVGGAPANSVEAAELRWEAIRALDLDVFVNASFGSSAVNPASLGIYMCMFPVPAKPENDLYLCVPSRSPGGHSPSPGNWLDSYDVVTANSVFTASHIKSRWSRVAVPVFTPCSPVPSGVKENIILNVARFDPYKRQDALISAFRSSEVLRRGGWSLHLVGSVASTSRAHEYVDHLADEVGDDCISIHRNATRRLLEDLYGRAAIYWHATGFGERFADGPEYHEHFGQTVVEAMSAGAVSVVIDAGGPAETVAHAITGYRWSTIPELVRRTEQLVADPELRHRMGANAIEASRAFTPFEFCRRMDEVLDNLLRARA